MDWRHTSGYAGQGVRNGIGGVVDVKVAVVLPEPAGDDANAKAPPHFVLGLCDAILVAFGGVTRQQGDVILLRAVRLEVRAVERVQRDADRVGV